VPLVVQEDQLLLGLAVFVFEGQRLTSGRGKEAIVTAVLCCGDAARLAWSISPASAQFTFEMCARVPQPKIAKKIITLLDALVYMA